MMLKKANWPGALVLAAILLGIFIPGRAFAEYYGGYAYPGPYNYRQSSVGVGVNVGVGGYRQPVPPPPPYYGPPRRGGVNVRVNVGAPGAHGINTFSPLAAGVQGAESVRVVVRHPCMPCHPHRCRRFSVCLRVNVHGGGCGGCHRRCF